MAKSSGEQMTPVQLPARPRAKPQPIRHQVAPKGPRGRPNSQGVSQQADRLAPDPMSPSMPLPGQGY